MDFEWLKSYDREVPHSLKPYPEQSVCWKNQC